MENKKIQKREEREYVMNNDFLDRNLFRDIFFKKYACHYEIIDSTKNRGGDQMANNKISEKGGCEYVVDNRSLDRIFCICI